MIKEQTLIHLLNDGANRERHAAVYCSTEQLHPAGPYTTVFAAR